MYEIAKLNPGAEDTHTCKHWFLQSSATKRSEAKTVFTDTAGSIVSLHKHTFSELLMQGWKKNGRTSRRQYYRISYDSRGRKNAFSWYSVTSDVYSFQDVSVNLISSFSRLFLFSFSETKCCFPSVVDVVLATQPRLVQAHSRYSCLSARIIGVCLHTQCLGISHFD